MSRQISIGLIAEGGTDRDYLTSLISRVYQRLAFECRQIPDIRDIDYREFPRTDAPVYIMKGAQKFYGYFDILCVHLDADGRSDRDFRTQKLEPGLRALSEVEGGFIKIIVPIVPIRTLENWMLADRAALKKTIGTDLSDQTLEIQHPPESYPTPKDTIKSAIRTHENQRRGRRRKQDIRDLYLPLGQTASLDELLKLPSFRRFYAAARQSLVDLGLIAP